MVKRLTAVILILSFFIVGIPPAFAENEDDADERRARAVLVAVGVVAVVGSFFMVWHMTKNSYLPDLLIPNNKHQNQGLKFGLDLSDSGIISNSYSGEYEIRSPVLKISW